jgi:hypothetical protein
MPPRRLAVTSAVGPAAPAMESTASVKSTTTVEPAAIAATVGLAPTMEAVTAAEATTMEAPATTEPLVTLESATTMPFASATPSSTFSTKSLAAAESVMVSIPTATIVAAPSAIIATAVVATEPRPRANEHASVKIVRPIVAVRRAGIRRIIVIPVDAIWRRAVIAWADSYKNLGMSSASCQEHEYPDQCRVL